MSQDLTFEQALAEGIHILQIAYEGTLCRGYDAAYLDAAQPPPGGLGIVLSRMAAGIIAVQRPRHIRSILAGVLGPMGWEQRCKVAELLLQQNHALLEGPLNQCDPSQLANAIPELAITVAGQWDLLRQVTSAISTFPA